eukprot:COSAG01_NODE_10606_length_2122_cov_1110.873950_2_plen_85_part_00
MRAATARQALELGLTLNEHALSRLGADGSEHAEEVPVADERALFAVRPRTRRRQPSTGGPLACLSGLAEIGADGVSVRRCGWSG